MLTHKTYQSKLFKQQVASQSTIDGQVSTLEKLNAQIVKAKDDQDKANAEKVKLDEKTAQLQKEKDDETSNIQKLREDTETKKQELKDYEAKCHHDDQ